jgi:hypothetical protein
MNRIVLLGGLDVYGSTILKCILREGCGRVLTWLICLRGVSSNGQWTSSSLKGEEFLEPLNNCYALKKGSPSLLVIN